jgi:hypothetical protein
MVTDPGGVAEPSAVCPKPDGASALDREREREREREEKGGGSERHSRLEGGVTKT